MASQSSQTNREAMTDDRSLGQQNRGAPSGGPDLRPREFFRAVPIVH